tara:strand:- start:161 stop:445 length:285 start_codon:yes stop_codon:yes gene_type:complete
MIEEPYSSKTTISGSLVKTMRGNGSTVYFRGKEDLIDPSGFLLDSQAVYRVQVIDKREQQQNQSICIDSASAIESRIEGYNFTSLSVSRTRLIP